MPSHFGLIVNEGKYGLRLTREKYAIISNKNSFSIKFSADIYADEQGKTYKDEWCKKHLINCLENYDLNITYFSLLDRNKFNEEIKIFKRINKEFKDVKDLNLYDGKSGYYLMILDDYCQIYIGTTNDIKKRIRQHWNNQKQFDRLLFPMNNVNGSMLSIDSFRSLDTTRILAYKTYLTYEKEDDYVNQFSPEFVCNRLAGGKITGGLPQAICMMKSRNLVKN